MNDTLEAVIPDKITLICQKCKKKVDIMNISQYEKTPVWICPECIEKTPYPAESYHMGSSFYR